MAQQPQNPEQSAGQGGAPKIDGNIHGRKGFMSTLITIFIFILILTIITGVGYYLFFVYDDEYSSNDALSANLNSEAILSSAPIFMQPLNYQVNLADGRRFVIVDIRIEVLNIQSSDFINSRLPIVNDIIISTLQRKTAAELKTASGADQLKRDLRRRLNSGKLFSENFINLIGTATPINNVYFDKFILQ